MSRHPSTYALSLALLFLSGLVRADEPAHPADKHADAKHDAPSPPLHEGLPRLTAGNARFVTGKSSHPDQTAKRIAETAEGQHPFVTVLSCSDSRVPPEVLFDEGIGDVFSVRVAGNVSDTDEMGSVEYGVDHLGTPLLVVMGHTKCGAVTAVATHAQVHGHIPELVDNILPAVEATRKKFPNAGNDDLVKEAIRANVFQSMATLLRDSEAVRARVESGKTEMVGAVYDIATGKVEWLGPHPDAAALMEEGKKLAANKPAHGEAHEEHEADAGEHKKDETAASEEKKGADDKGKKAPEGPVGPAAMAFVLVAIVCTLGGTISGRMTK